MKVKYSNLIYGFDIETTTINHITTHYLSCFCSVDFEHKNKRINEIVNNISFKCFCRTEKDINNFLLELNENAINNQEYIIIYVHNLSYEFDYLIKNIQFIKDNFKNENSLFLKSRIPLFFRVGNLEFRCSYKLLNKSLKKCGENLGFQKLEIDYKNKYFNFSKLPEVEYKYNNRDVTLMLVAILKECNNWQYINTVNDIPLTSTSFTRKNNQFINDSKTIKEYSRRCNYQRYYSSDDVLFLESIFSGGYTHANAFYFAKPLKNIASLDIISAYPHEMLHRQYPIFFKKYVGNYKLDYLLKLYKANKGDYMEKLKNYNKPFKYSFFACVKLINVKAKILKNRNLILPISLSKCVDIQAFKIDNGRIFKAKTLTININEVDLYIYSLFYDFKIVECFKLWHTKYYKFLPTFITNSVRQYLYEKSTLKAILKAFENGQEITPDLFYNEKKGDYIYPDEQINSICDLRGDELEQVLNDNYRASKNKLNAQYGINVQKLLNHNYNYNTDDDKFSNQRDTEIIAKVLYRDFSNGLYITSYARLTLFLFGLYLIDNANVTLIYSDTDSWKCKGDIKRIKEATEKYNEMIKSIIDNDNDYFIGCFDLEDVYKNFCTLGCKKYIVDKNNKIISTIAGLNKVKTSKALTELYNKLDNDFSLLCEIAFSPNTIIGYSVTDKLISAYSNNKYNMIVIDENGKKGNISGVNMVELCLSDYILMNTDKRGVRDYVDFALSLQNKNPEIISTIVYRNSKGEISYKYVTDWKKQVKALQSTDIEFENILL